MQKRYLQHIMRYQDDINTEHYMKLICCEAVDNAPDPQSVLQIIKKKSLFK